MNALLILKNKFVLMALAIAVGLFAINWYTGGQVEKKLLELKIKTILLIEDTGDAVDKADDNLGSGSIIDGLFPSETKSTSDRQNDSDGNSDKTPDANAEIQQLPRDQANGGNWPSLELFNPSLSEFAKKGTTDTEILQEEEIICDPDILEVLKSYNPTALYKCIPEGLWVIVSEPSFK